MKIALIAAGAWPRIGGIENSLRFLAQELLSAGHEVKIVCYQRPVDLPSSDRFEGVEIIRIPLGKGHRLPHIRLKLEVERASEGLREVFDDYQPDFIWSRYHTMGLAAVRAGWGSRLLHIFPITAELASSNLIAGRAPSVKEWLKCRINYWLNCAAQGKVERELYRSARCVVFSQFMSQELTRAYGKKQITKIKPGVDLEYFSCADESSQFELRNRLAIKRDDRVLLYVGRLAAYKNIPMLVSALSRLPSAVKLLLIGDGPEQAVLESLVARLNLKSRVFFVGSQREDLGLYYSMADVTVVPSVVESFGQVYLESFACGTPAVGFSSDLKQCRVATNEVIRDGMTGIVCRKFSAFGLSESINQLLALSTEEYQELSEQCISLVDAEYSWSQTVARLVEISLAATPHCNGNEL